MIIGFDLITDLPTSLMRSAESGGKERSKKFLCMAVKSSAVKSRKFQWSCIRYKKASAQKSK